MEPVSFAVVGLGMGRGRSRLVKETDGARLAMVVDIDKERAQGVGEELEVPWALSIDEALARDDIECVFVLTPSGTHAEVAIQAARAGKHVITTKPMDVSVEACTRLIRACDEAGVHLMVDFQSRYVDANVQLRHAVQAGWLGKPLIGEFRFKWWRSQAYYDARDGWRGTWKLDGGGSLANQGVHGLDMLMWTMGDVDALYAEVAVMNHDIETEDVGLVIIDFASGAKGAVTTTTTYPGTSPYYSLEVHGTEGGVLLDNLLDGQGRYHVPDDVKEKMAGVPNPVKNIIQDAVQVIRYGAQPAIDGREGRRTVALLEAIYRSAREGRKVPFECPAD